MAWLDHVAFMDSLFEPYSYCQLDSLQSGRISWSSVACSVTLRLDGTHEARSIQGHSWPCQTTPYIDSILFREYTVYMAGHAALNKHSYI